MKRVLRCHDFRSGREAIRSQYREYWQGERQSHGRKVVPALRVAARIAARRNAKQGSAQRGVGTRLRDATVKPIVRRVVLMPILRASTGLHPRRGPCSALRRARLRGCDRKGPRESRGWARLRPATGSHPITKRLEPVPPSAGHFVGLLVDIRDIDCAVLRARTVARSRGPRGGCDRKGERWSHDSVRLRPDCGVASRHETPGTCSALRGTHNPGRNAHVPNYVRGSKP
jgi:hypothetical protein